MSLDNWDEVRTAFQVAKMGTVSGAAQILGVHHATVIRHIDSLEQTLGVKLFQRHARGYTATEAGSDLLKVAQTTDDQFSQLVSRIKGRGDDVSGELIITSLPDLSRLIGPVLADFQAQHPKLIVRYLTGERVFRLEYGEAHVAVRTGNPPQEPDNVVQPFFQQGYGLYVHKRYLDRFGPLDTANPIRDLRYVGLDDLGHRAPTMRWLSENATPDQITYRVTSFEAGSEAVKAGIGAGFLMTADAIDNDDLIPLLTNQEGWTMPNWLVTHVDLHRTPKVQAVLSFLKQHSKDWSID
ncbi:DNA-binding transcriptional LysR family regulator [Pacificibacter maritimus]|uniref:DNA-binding transcriptional LysR family regulator n=1 Tax=Pacificibacter maritimus TaxID=762213 RepID=A0A3N4UQE8_9RHOB|nr:LysR family transcriptional regulator [Pacificibacter maritimus]RPE67207.1 DNA-binding transcriptional LysR family regulator [Pacificibacter maritimus]